jgi:hypothetical protein
MRGKVGRSTRTYLVDMATIQNCQVTATAVEAANRGDSVGPGCRGRAKRDEWLSVERGGASGSCAGDVNDMGEGSSDRRGGADGESRIEFHIWLGGHRT